MEEGYKVPFKLNRILTTQFASFPETKIDEDDINLETRLSFANNDRGHLVTLFANVRFVCKGNIFLTIEMGCEFEIVEQAYKSFEKAEGLVVPKALVSHFAVITLGTVRGALHAKTENTPFNEYVLPTINVTDLVTEDLIFKEDKKNQV